VIVCLCQGVPEDAVRNAIAAGASTVRDVSKRCGAGTDCRACCPMLASLIQEAQGGLCVGAAK
jgi:bacterioferritin-associated ferredoxin